MSPVPSSLDAAIAHSLDGLLHALVLEPQGDDRFRVQAEPDRFTRVFGGQTVAQALLAAADTVDDKAPHSLHAYFVEAGRSDEPLTLVVDRVRDGRSMSTRRVTVTQDDRTILIAMASFHENPPGPEVADPPPTVPGPDELPVFQDWVRDLPPDLAHHSTSWVEQPPPLDLRIGEPPNFLGGPSAAGTRSHWMRLPREVGDDTLLHTVLLAYASDYFLLDMAFRSYPERIAPGAITSFSIDHALWFHQPVRFERWHLHTQETVALVAHRGLVRGAIHDLDGRLVATAMQEVLLRPTVRRT
jgi:acyl-CoA thioesterase-2